MYLRAHSKVNQFIFLFFGVIGIFIILARNNVLFFFVGLELNTFSSLIIVFCKSDSKSNKGSIVYMVVKILATICLLWGIVFCSNFIFLLGLFFKMRFFPFLWWFPYIRDGLKYWCFIFLKVLQKVAPFMLLYVNKILSRNHLYLLISVSYGIALINLYYNQQNIKVFLAWSSTCNLRLMILFIVFSWRSSLLYFFIYSFVLVIFVFILNKEFVFYWRDLFQLKKTKAWVIFLCLLVFMGFPPLLGFLYKAMFFLSLIYLGRWGFMVSFFIFFIVVFLLFCNRVIYLNLATKLNLKKVGIFRFKFLIVIYFFIFFFILNIIFYLG